MSLALSALDGRVVLKGFLGEGGMGQVHRAWDQVLERAVAVKFFRGANPQEAERLLLEARLQARVEHPHVVKVHEVGTLGGRPCIVLQLVEGRSLAGLAPSLSPGARAELLRQVAEGLHAAHRQGLLHRDIKPDNVLVEETPEGLRALVSDFGLAREQDGGYTKSGFPAGTLDFMSPEQLLGRGPLDFRSDVYSLGATFYSVLAGRHPYRDSLHATSGGLATPDSTTGTEDPSGLLRRILEDEPPPLKRLVPGLPKELTLIVAKAMEKDPAQRYASAEAFAEDLGRFQRGEPILARAPWAMERALKWGRRNRTAARALIVAALTVLLGLGYAVWASQRAGREALEAARLGALAESLESRVRMEQLSPPHDLRPVLGSVRSEVEVLKPLAARRRGGPAAFALGKGLDLLGDLDGARDAYERAWDQGFRTPQMAEALGLALGRVYERELRQAKATLSPEGLQQRIPVLEASLRDPARRYLERGNQTGWRGPWLRAFIALLDQDFEAARARAREVLAADPGRYEAKTLEAEAWLWEAAQRIRDVRIPDAESATDRAEIALNEALLWGRSDPRVFRDITWVHTLRAQASKETGRDPAPETAAALNWLGKATLLNPDDPGLHVQHASALMELAMHNIPAGRPGGMALVEQSIALLERAARVLPRDVQTRLKLTHALFYRATVTRSLGKPSMPFVETALKSLETLRVLAPAEPESRYVGMRIHLEEAQALQALGKDAGPAFRSVVEEGEKTLALFPANSMRTLFVLASAQANKGKQAWFSGQDPRADFAKSVTRSEEMLKAAPGNPSVPYSAVELLLAVADQLPDMGEDPRALLTRTLVIVDEAVAKHPDYSALQSLKGSVLLLEAYRLTAAGEDPGPMAREARTWLTKGVKGRSNPSTGLNLGFSHYTEARWREERGIDPNPVLSEAEKQFKAVLKAQPENAYAQQGLAQCALEQAAWLRRQGLPTVSEGAKGLPLIARSMAMEPRDPAPPVIQARLYGFAGDRDAGRKSLEKAVSLNPLVKRSREYQLAVGELARN